jgi:hypothetical protein
MIENLAVSPWQFPIPRLSVKAQFVRLPEEGCQCVSPVDVDIIWHFLTFVVDLS